MTDMLTLYRKAEEDASDTVDVRLEWAYELMAALRPDDVTQLMETMEAGDALVTTKLSPEVRTMLEPLTTYDAKTANDRLSSLSLVDVSHLCDVLTAGEISRKINFRTNVNELRHGLTNLSIAMTQLHIASQRVESEEAALAAEGT